MTSVFRERLLEFYSDKNTPCSGTGGDTNKLPFGVGTIINLGKVHKIPCMNAALSLSPTVSKYMMDYTVAYRESQQRSVVLMIESLLKRINSVKRSNYHFKSPCQLASFCMVISLVL